MREQYVKPTEAAKALGLSSKHLRKWANEGFFSRGAVLTTPGGHHVFCLEKCIQDLQRETERQVRNRKRLSKC